MITPGTIGIGVLSVPLLGYQYKGNGSRGALVGFRIPRFYVLDCHHPRIPKVGELYLAAYYSEVSGVDNNGKTIAQVIFSIDTEGQTSEKPFLGRRRFIVKLDKTGMIPPVPSNWMKG